MEWNRHLFFLLLLTAMLIANADDLGLMLAKYPRAAQAASNTNDAWNQRFSESGMAFPPERLFIRAFKQEKELELWASDGGPFTLVKTYPICMLPGKLGPKTRQGDKQVPEGIYYVDTLNPDSDFHLSFRINYPNKADLIRSRNEKDPGGDIYIHGDCISVGCLPMGDEAIEELFWLIALHQAKYPDIRVPVHLLPFRFDSPKNVEWHRSESPWNEFWQQLRDIQSYFEQTGLLPEVEINDKGDYVLAR